MSECVCLCVCVCVCVCVWCVCVWGVVCVCVCGVWGVCVVCGVCVWWVWCACACVCVVCACASARACVCVCVVCACACACARACVFTAGSDAWLPFWRVLSPSFFKAQIWAISILTETTPPCLIFNKAHLCTRYGKYHHQVLTQVCKLTVL